MLGFTQSFNSAHFCRFCKIEKRDIQDNFYERQDLLRNENNYTADLLANDVKSTGISEECLFHKIPRFHATKNLSVDVLHDILEGICQYDLGLILNYFIRHCKFFDLNELNHLVRGFDYGPHRNAPPEILASHIKKKRLMMSGAEMLCFVRHLLLIISHLVPHDNHAWELIIQLTKIVELAMSNVLSPHTYHISRQLIGDYLQCLTTMFPKCLRPKHHFLTHYPTVFSSSGPFSKMSGIRCEGKHRDAKMTAKTSLNRQNISRTIAIKHQLRLNFRLMTDQDSNLLEYDPLSL